MTLGAEPHETVWNDYIRADFAIWPVGQDCPVHFHEDAVEIFIFLDGQCEMTVGDEVQVVGAGQVAPGAELGALVARGGDLVEDARPGELRAAGLHLEDPPGDGGVT